MVRNCVCPIPFRITLYTIICAFKRKITTFSHLKSNYLSVCINLQPTFVENPQFSVFTKNSRTYFDPGFNGIVKNWKYPVTNGVLEFTYIVMWLTRYGRTEIKFN